MLCGLQAGDLGRGEVSFHLHGRPENQGADGVDSSLDLKAQVPGAQRTREDNVPAQAIRQERLNSSFLHLCVPFRPSEDWAMPTNTGESKLL